MFNENLIISTLLIGYKYLMYLSTSIFFYFTCRLQIWLLIDLKRQEYVVLHTSTLISNVLNKVRPKNVLCTLM